MIDYNKRCPAILIKNELFEFKRQALHFRSTIIMINCESTVVFVPKKEAQYAKNNMWKIFWPWSHVKKLKNFRTYFHEGLYEHVIIY